MINCLPVSDLTTDELVEELRTIFKMFSHAETQLHLGGYATKVRANHSGYRGKDTDPDFFLGRLGYLNIRATLVKGELDKRKDKTFANVILLFDSNWQILPAIAWGPWSPTIFDVEACRQDILAKRHLNMAG